MKYVVACFFALGLPTFVHSQTEIKLDSVSKHIGDSVIVCAQVDDAYYASRVENTPTFLNIGGKYPNQKLTIVIWNDVRGQFSNAPEVYYKDKKICVTGKLELFQAKPQIVIKTPSQIKLQ